MNALSKLLYWGNVAGNLGGFLIFLGILLVVASVVLVILQATHTDSALQSLKYRRDDAEALAILKQAGKRRLVPFLAGFLFVIGVASWTTAAFCPSADTVYAIAASEMGEKALETPLATKAGKALESWLDSKIASPAAVVRVEKKVD